MTIAVQGAIGEIGGKPVTGFTGYSFNSTATINGFTFGASKTNGLCLLNTGNQDNGSDFTKTFTLATTDVGVGNPKRIRFVYIGIETDSASTVSVKADNQAWRDYNVPANKAGLQRVRVPIGRDGQGRYWTIKISSSAQFRIDEIKALFIKRSHGLITY